MAIFSGCENNSIDKFKVFGNESFTIQKWADANQEQRATLLFDFVNANDIKHMTGQQIIEKLGKPTGYYDYDEYPAYFVGPKSITSKYGKGYLVAFVVNRDTQYVKNVVVIPDP